MDLSIVTTLYRSAETIEQFHRRVSRCAQGITTQFEIIFVNDGSPDESLAVALRLHAEDPRVRVVDLSRNFGHHHAIMAGLAHAIGDRVFLIDVDLEEDPEWLVDFWRLLTDESLDVVFGVQEARGGDAFKKHTGALFYQLFNKLSTIRIPESPCTVRLMSRGYVDALLRLQDKNLFLAGNFAWTGFQQRSLPVSKRAASRASSYTPGRMFFLFVNALTSFTAYPLWLIFLMGLLISFLSGVGGSIMIVKKLLNPSGVQLGFASIIVSIWFMGGLIVFFLGVIGIYLSAVFNEVKDRPTFLVRHFYTKGGDGDQGPR